MFVKASAYFRGRLPMLRAIGILHVSLVSVSFRGVAKQGTSAFSLWELPRETDAL